MIEVGKPHFVYLCIGILRVLIKLQAISEKEKSDVKLLMAHTTETSDDEELAKALRKSNEFLVKFCKFQNITENDVFWAFGVLQTNSIGLANGRGLYPIASIMSHSCVPTLTLMTKLGEGIAFKSNRIICDQEELTIRYFDWLECKLCLRKALKKKWHFDCTCLRCQSPDDLKTFISAPKCQACLQDDKTGYLIPETPLDHASDWICQQCSQKYIVTEIYDMESRAKLKMADMEKNGKTPQEIIGELEKDFHPNYHLILHQKWKVVMGDKASNYQGNPAIVAQYCKDLMPIVDILDGEMSESKGKIGSKWATIEMNLRKEKMVKKLITMEEFLQEIKPWLRVQVESKRLIL